MAKQHRFTLVNSATRWRAEARLSVDLLHHWVAEFSWHKLDGDGTQRAGYSQEVLFSENDARTRLAVFVAARKRAGYVEQAH